MLLPISKAFQSLKTRLECINVATFEMPMGVNKDPKHFFGDDYDMHKSDVKINIEECLHCFDEKLVQINNFYEKKEED